MALPSDRQFVTEGRISRYFLLDFATMFQPVDFTNIITVFYIFQITKLVNLFYWISLDLERYHTFLHGRYQLRYNVSMLNGLVNNSLMSFKAQFKK